MKSLALPLLLLAAPCYAQSHDFYVAPGGVDSGTCTTAGQPCATITYAAQQALTTPALASKTQLVHLAKGNYAESVIASGAPPASATSIGSAIYETLAFVCDPGVTWNGSATWNGTLTAMYGANIGVVGCTMLGTGNPNQTTLFANLGGQINVYDGVTFGPAAFEHLHAEGSGSQINVWNGYAVTGSAQIHAVATTNANIEFNPISYAITFGPGVGFSSEVFDIENNGTIYIGSNVSFSGSVTGEQYYASTNGVLHWKASTGKLPGSTPGTTQYGGQYVGPSGQAAAASATPASTSAGIQSTPTPPSTHAQQAPTATNNLHPGAAVITGGISW